MQVYWKRAEPFLPGFLQEKVRLKATRVSNSCWRGCTLLNLDVVHLLYLLFSSWAAAQLEHWTSCEIDCALRLDQVPRATQLYCTVHRFVIKSGEMEVFLSRVSLLKTEDIMRDYPDVRTPENGRNHAVLNYRV